MPGQRAARRAICTSPMRVEEHPFFKRDGDNIKIQVPLTVTRGRLGAKIEVPTIDGRALLKIPARNAERTEVPAA